MGLSDLTNRFFPGEKRHSRYWSLVEQVGKVTHSSRDIDSALGAAADELGRALDLLRCAIVVRREGGPTRSSYTALNLSTTFKEKLSLADGELAREAESSGALFEISQAATDARLAPILNGGPGGSAADAGLSSILVAPLVADSVSIGAIILYSRGKQRWSPVERQFIQAIASSLSLAVFQLQSQEQAKRAADREALINRLLSSIRSCASVDEILGVAVEGIGAALAATRVVIYANPDGSLSRAANAGAGLRLTARAEYRSSVLVPSLLDTGLDVEGSPILARLLAGEIVSIPDTNESHPTVREVSVRLGVRALALAPLSYNGQTVAALALEQFDKPREFSDVEINLIRLVAEQTAVAIYQAELYREAQESARRDALISKISSAIHRSLDSDQLLEAIVNELGAALSTCRSRLALLPTPLPEAIPITHEYVAPCCARRRPAMRAIPSFNNPLLQAVLSSPAPVAVDDATTELKLAPFREEFQEAGIQSMLSTAIRIDGCPIGLLILHQCEQRHSWTRWEIAVLESVAEQAAVAIRQADLYREVRESAMRVALANQIVASIRRSLDLSETLQVAVDELGRALCASRTYFHKLVGGENLVVAECLSDPRLSVRGARGSATNYISSYLMKTRRTLVIDDLRSFVADHPQLDGSAHAWQVEPENLSQIVCPIFVNGRYWGALSIGQTDQPRKWTASEIALVEAVTAQIEVAVSHSNLFEEAKNAARRESLIARIVNGINHSNQLEEIFPVVARELGEHLAADTLLITRLNEETDLWTIDCAYSGGKVSRPARTYKAEDFATFAPMVEEDVIRCNDAEGDPRFAPYLDRFLRPAGTRAFLAVRLFYKGEPRIAISAIMKSGPRAWTDDEVDVVRAATDQVFIALQRVELFEQISHGKYEWEATFDALTDGIFIFDQRGSLRRVNQAGAAFEGGSMREMIGRRCCTLLQGIEGEQCRVAQVINSARPVTFELVPERLSRPVLVTIAPLSVGPQGYLDHAEAGGAPQPALGAVCIVRDLSELRAAEAVAREQRSFLVKLIEHANDAIFAFSPEGRLVWFNEQLAGLSGYSREELHATNAMQFIAEDEKKPAVERFTRALAGEAQTFEMHALKKSGESRLLLITYTPIYDEGRVTSVLSIARDITEERLASERAAQADKLRALGQLASGVAHNFNNVLAAILGHAQLIKRESRDERTAQRIDIIERAALDGAQTVKRIQGFGQPQSDSSYESVDLNQLVQDSTTLTRARWCDEAQARGLRYEVDVELQPLPPVRGSASQLREVFVNIILNALDAMPQGGRLRIATESKDGLLRVSFTDSGIGMSREVRDRIFEPFFTTKGVTGMGLGLAVSYSIVERHGGRIEARSNPGRGTAFTITLPAAGLPARRSKGEEASLVKKAASVLVIDDDERVREALVGMLSSTGHQTQYAASGREALKKMEGSRFDLVFTDLSMPEMDGWAVAGEIRRRWPGVKIVLITGYGVTPEVVNNHRHLVNEVIFKPIRMDDINSTLSHMLS